VLRHCLWPDEIDGIDLDSFGWDSMFGLTYGVQTGTKRRLGHSLAQIGLTNGNVSLASQN